jgi:hypothetical protein
MMIAEQRVEINKDYEKKIGKNGNLVWEWMKSE